MLAHFVLWYGFLRIFADIFRYYETSLLGLATGQSFNLFMSLLGGGLLLWLRKKPASPAAAGAPPVASATSDSERPAGLWMKRIVLAALILFSLTLPSDRTQDIPARYSERHPGLRYSFFYPRIEPSKLLSSPTSEETSPPDEQRESKPQH